MMGISLGKLWLIHGRLDLFFFRLNTFLNVENVNPSQFYLEVQRMSRIIVPIIILTLLTTAMT